MNRRLRAMAAAVMGLVHGVQALPAVACGGDYAQQQKQTQDEVDRANAFLAQVFGANGEDLPRAITYSVNRCLNSPYGAKIDGLDTKDEVVRMMEALNKAGVVMLKGKDGQPMMMVPDDVAKRNPGMREVSSMLNGMFSEGR